MYRKRIIGNNTVFFIAKSITALFANSLNLYCSNDFGNI